MIVAQAGVNLTGFLMYKILVIVANSIAKALIGRGLSLGANAALVKALGVFAGPIGWTVSGIWTIVSICGPAYRKTIPLVYKIGLLRMKKRYANLVST